MRVVICEPGKYARIADIEGGLASFQSIVGDTICAGYPWEEQVAIVCDDNGEALHLPFCRYIENYQSILGTFIICGLSDCNFAGLTEEQAVRYEQMFHFPEAKIHTPFGWTILCCSPQNYEIVTEATRTPQAPKKKPHHPEK